MSMEFNLPRRGNDKLIQTMDAITSSKRLEGLWNVANVNAIDRLSINDHGPVHSKIVANSGLRMYRIIHESGVEPSISRDYEEMTAEDAEVVIVMGAVLHDLGHAVHRKRHEEFAIGLSDTIIRDLLEGIYPPGKLAIMEGEILHAVYSHKSDVQPLTLEAGILKVADALDMEQGRARIPFQEGEVTIHSVSALSIERIKIERGSTKPVKVTISMSNSAGIFQIDSLFKKKFNKSGVKQYINVQVEFMGEGDQEKKIVEDYQI